LTCPIGLGCLPKLQMGTPEGWTQSLEKLDTLLAEVLKPECCHA
jgi:hypothetical protein